MIIYTWWNSSNFFVLFCLTAFSNFSVVHIHCFCIKKNNWKFVLLRLQDTVPDLNACLNLHFSSIPRVLIYARLRLLLEIAVYLLAVNYWRCTCFTVIFGISTSMKSSFIRVVNTNTQASPCSIASSTTGRCGRVTDPDFKGPKQGSPPRGRDDYEFKPRKKGGAVLLAEGTAHVENSVRELL